MANTHCVYCHLNKVNGKMYIGQASNTQKKMGAFWLSALSKNV